jgi:hypothetical protein
MRFFVFFSATNILLPSFSPLHGPGFSFLGLRCSLDIKWQQCFHNLWELEPFFRAYNISLQFFDKDDKKTLIVTTDTLSKFSLSKFSLTKFLMENFDSDNGPLGLSTKLDRHWLFINKFREINVINSFISIATSCCLFFIYM